MSSLTIEDATFSPVYVFVIFAKNLAAVAAFIYLWSSILCTSFSSTAVVYTAALEYSLKRSIVMPLASLFLSKIALATQGLVSCLSVGFVVWDFVLFCFYINFKVFLFRQRILFEFWWILDYICIFFSVIYTNPWVRNYLHLLEPPSISYFNVLKFSV